MTFTEGKQRKPRVSGVTYVKSYMVARRNEDGSIERVSIEVVNGEWPQGTFTVRRRKVSWVLQSGCSEH